MTRIFLAFSLLCLLGAQSSSATADDKDRDRIPLLAQLSNKEQSQAADRKKNAEARAEKAKEANSNAKQQFNEKRVLEFVGKHQPELQELLEFMKEKRPSQYQQAMREMARSQQRLESLAKKDQELHAIELELWNVRSRLRLVAAQIPTVKEKQRVALEKELRELVEREIKQNHDKLVLQKQRMEVQVKKLADQISRIENEPEKMINNSLKSWQNRIAKQNPRSKRDSVRSKDTSPPRNNDK